MQSFHDFASAVASRQAVLTAVLDEFAVDDTLSVVSADVLWRAFELAHVILPRTAELRALDGARRFVQKHTSIEGDPSLQLAFLIERLQGRFVRAYELCARWQDTREPATDAGVERVAIGRCELADALVSMAAELARPLPPHLRLAGGAPSERAADLLVEAFAPTGATDAVEIAPFLAGLLMPDQHGLLAHAQQPPPAHAQQPPPAHAQQPPPAHAQQPPPAHAQQPQQPPPAHAQQPQQPPPAHAQQPPPAHAQQPQQPPPAHAQQPHKPAHAQQPHKPAHADTKLLWPAAEPSLAAPPVNSAAQHAFPAPQHVDVATQHHSSAAQPVDPPAQRARAFEPLGAPAAARASSPQPAEQSLEPRRASLARPAARASSPQPAEQSLEPRRASLARPHRPAPATRGGGFGISGAPPPPQPAAPPSAPSFIDARRAAGEALERSGARADGVERAAPAPAEPRVGAGSAGAPSTPLPTRSSARAHAAGDRERQSPSSMVKRLASCADELSRAREAVRNAADGAAHKRRAAQQLAAVETPPPPCRAASVPTPLSGRRSAAEHAPVPISCPPAAAKPAPRAGLVGGAPLPTIRAKGAEAPDSAPDDPQRAHHDGPDTPRAAKRAALAQQLDEAFDSLSSPLALGALTRAPSSEAAADLQRGIAREMGARSCEADNVNAGASSPLGSLLRTALDRARSSEPVRADSECGNGRRAVGSALCALGASAGNMRLYAGLR